MNLMILQFFGNTKKLGIFGATICFKSSKNGHLLNIDGYHISVRLKQPDFVLKVECQHVIYCNNYRD